RADRDDPVFSGIRLNAARDDELLHVDVKLLKAGELADAHPGVDQDQDGPSPHIARFGQLGDRTYFQIGKGALLGLRFLGQHHVLSIVLRDQVIRHSVFEKDSRQNLDLMTGDRKSTRLNYSHVKTSYAVLRLKKKTQK